MRSPPTCISSTLIASRINLRRTHIRSRERVSAGKSSHQPAPAAATVTTRTITRSGSPQPTVTTACPTAEGPDQIIRPMKAETPINQAMATTCLTLTIPILQFEVTRLWLLTSVTFRFSLQPFMTHAFFVRTVSQESSHLIRAVCAANRVAQPSATQNSHCHRTSEWRRVVLPNRVGREKPVAAPPFSS